LSSRFTPPAFGKPIDRSILATILPGFAASPEPGRLRVHHPDFVYNQQPTMVNTGCDQTLPKCRIMGEIKYRELRLEKFAGRSNVAA
jgi:hypothetical protein